MNMLKTILILLFCVITIVLTIFYKNGYPAKANKYELTGLYPHENGIAFEKKDVRCEGKKIGFVGRIVPTPKIYYLYFYIDQKTSIPKDSGFYEAATYKGQTYINIRKGKDKDNLQNGEAIKYINVLKEIEEQRQKYEETKKPSPIQTEWVKTVANQIITISEFLENFHKGLQDMNKGLKPTKSNIKGME